MQVFGLRRFRPARQRRVRRDGERVGLADVDKPDVVERPLSVLDPPLDVELAGRAGLRLEPERSLRARRGGEEASVLVVNLPRIGDFVAVRIGRDDEEIDGAADLEADRRVRIGRRGNDLRRMVRVFLDFERKAFRRDRPGRVRDLDFKRIRTACPRLRPSLQKPALRDGEESRNSVPIHEPPVVGFDAAAGSEVCVEPVPRHAGRERRVRHDFERGRFDVQRERLGGGRAGRVRNGDV